MKVLSLISILIVCIVLLICVVNNNKSLTEQRIHELIDEGFSKSDNILLHKEKVDNGIVVFYGDIENENTLGVRFIKKKLLNWEATYDRGGGGFGGSMESISSMYLPRYSSKSPFPLLMGLISDRKIAEIKVEYKYKGVVKEVKAKTIQGNDRYIWFAFVDEPLERTIYTINGFSKQGEMVETVEELSIPIRGN